MDKLELDARVARIERRVSFLFGLAVIGLGVFGMALGLVLLRVTVSEAAPLPAPTAVEVATPLPTDHASYYAPTPSPAMGMMVSDGSMPQLYQQMKMLRELLGENAITTEEWEAKKTMLLAEPLAAGDLRSDLQGVQDLWTNKAITEGERDTIKAKLLGLDKQEEQPCDEYPKQ